MEASEPNYDPLPIDNAAGLPQRFPYLRNGVRYRFSMYVNAPESALGSIDEIMLLPDDKRFLVVRIDVLAADGAQRIVFLRKVVPSLQYRAGGLLLKFPAQVVARRNLNGTGNFGSHIVGLVAS
jgi:hypothetical protein